MGLLMIGMLIERGDYLFQIVFQHLEVELLFSKMPWVFAEGIPGYSQAMFEAAAEPLLTSESNTMRRYSHHKNMHSNPGNEVYNTIPVRETSPNKTLP